MQLALGDALAIALLESRGFTATDFGMLHPSGRLGAMLKFARDLMHDGAAMPLIKTGTKMSDAIVEISSKGFGCVGVTDAHGMLVGIITDGDLRRHMRPDLLGARVEEVMTPNPKVADSEQLATEILELLNSSKITTVFVAEGRKPIGILHMHDLLRAGVA
jgi:arabinose-5-phosphate isomerase